MATAFVFSNKRDFSDDRDKTYVKRELFKVFPLFFLLFFFYLKNFDSFLCLVSPFFFTRNKNKNGTKRTLKSLNQRSNTFNDRDGHSLTKKIFIFPGFAVVSFNLF